MTAASGDRPLPPGIRLRRATEGDLATCAELWRDGINDYIGRLNQPLIPPELAPIRRLHEHLHASDGERFWVADRSGEPAPVAFASAARSFAGSCRPTTRRWRPRRTACSRSRTRCTRRTGSCRGSRC